MSDGDGQAQLLSKKLGLSPPLWPESYPTRVNASLEWRRIHLESGRTIVEHRRTRPESGRAIVEHKRTRLARQQSSSLGTARGAFRAAVRRSDVKTGRWSKEEDQALLEAVEEMGTKWTEVGVRVGRDRRACKDRYKEVLNGDRTRTGPWDEDEKARLKKVVHEVRRRKRGGGRGRE